MASKTYTSEFSALRATMEVCSEMVAEAYAKPLAYLEIYTGELPPGHRSSDRRQRYTVTEHEGDMIVALPGTTHPLDWSSNLRVNYTPVDGTTVSDPLTDLEEIPCAHAGFFYRSETVPTLQLLQQAAEKGRRLVFTGHSLGGAVANMCALTALNAQKRALAAAGDHAEIAAVARHISSIATSSEMPPASSQAGASAAAGTPCKDNNCCSCNSNFVLSPQAALVEVLSISFASPVFANAALARMIESNGWEECFVNLVVPEDYCLNLFNNVLTSAPQTDSKSPSRTPSTSRLFKATRMQTEYSEPQEPSEEPIPEAPLDPTGLPVSLVTPACALRSSSCGTSDLSSTTPSSSSGASYSCSSTPQQPLMSAMAGRSPSKLRSKRQLCFAEPLRQSVVDESNSIPGSTGNSDFSAVRPAVSKADSAAASGPTGWSRDGSQSPSGASLRSQGSGSSTRSWTLFAYLPASLTRTLDSWSSSNSMSSRRDSSSGGSCSGSTDSDTDLYEPFSGWGMRHAGSSVDISCGLSLSSGGSDSCDSTPTDDLDDLAAPFVSYNSSPCLDSNQLCSDPLCQAVGHSQSACTSNELDAQPQDKHQLQALQENRKAVLRKSFSSASLTILSQGHRKLLQPLSSAFKATDSLSVVSSLLPSMRAALVASRVVANAAYKVGEKAFNVPLGALEAGLIRALRPPMYEPVGQQWILSATGLVPQHQPVHQYPKHVSDVYWHKELALVAFKEHSIVFYKRRLLQQASRR